LVQTDGLTAGGKKWAITQDTPFDAVVAGLMLPFPCRSSRQSVHKIPLEKQEISKKCARSSSFAEPGTGSPKERRVTVKQFPVLVVNAGCSN
jgi:hypothetical protein